MNGLLLNNLKSANRIFDEEGILYFPQLFSGDQLERIRVSCEYARDQFNAHVDRHDPKLKSARSMRHLEEPRWHPDLQEHRLRIMETIAEPRCVGIVEQIIERTAIYKTTQLFFNPRAESRAGDWHRDLQFRSKDEDEVKDRIGRQGLPSVHLQIALVDNDDIEFVPFSAKRYDSPEEYYFRCQDNRSHNQEDGMPNAMRLNMRAGDAVSFNPNGLHRGRYLVDNPRRTLMLTYTPLDKPMMDPFSYQPWLLDEIKLDGLTRRTRVFFEDFIGVYQDYWRNTEASAVKP